MSFSIRHKNQRQQNQYLKTDKIAQAWANKCIRAQYKLASFVQAKSEKLSIGTKRLIVIAFCLISFSSSAYLIIEGFFGNDRVNLSTTAIRVPEQVTHNKHGITPLNSISKNEVEKIKKLRVYIDSLATSNTGRSIYDSIRMNRPGLIDSLTIIENIFKSQSSNK